MSQVEPDDPIRGTATGCTAAHSHGSGDAVHDLIVPLVEDRDLQSPAGTPVSVKVPSASHFVKANVSAIRAAQTHVALGVAEGITRSAAVQSLVRTAGSCARPLTWPVHGAGYTPVHRAPVQTAVTSGIDDRRIRKADGNVEAGRSKFLEVGRFI